MSILAIDQGTTSTRALRVDDGVAAITHAIRHRQYYPRPGWVEHDPEELIASIRQCLEGNRDVTAVGMDNQGESCLAWDAETKRAVCPVIVWQDNRTQGAIERLRREGAGEIVLEKAGLPLDSYFSASKLAWILENVPEARDLRRRGRLRVGTTDAFFIDRLGNRFATDITTASRTSLLNIRTGRWDAELCDLFGVPMELLPEIVPSTGDIAGFECDGRLLGLRASIVDQQASLHGHGCRHAGDAKITFGTGAFALTLTGGTPFMAPERGLLPTVAWQRDGHQPEYALDGGVYNAGSAVEWVRKLGLFRDYAEINSFDGPSAVERGLVFVPALSGLACPHWDRRAGGLWIGLSLDTAANDMVRAVLEGIALRAAEVIRAMADFVPVHDGISIDGGVSVNPYFCRFLATALGKRVTVKQAAEITAQGAAELAGAVIDPGIGGRETVYEPATDVIAPIERFTRAVERSRHWHGESD
ncbi:MAG: glycerol kinase [Proteobacteria bacterium]|nr:MAG: glycerol kinase [Pseudomonadota bacterium]